MGLTQSPRVWTHAGHRVTEAPCERRDNNVKLREERRRWRRGGGGGEEEVEKRRRWRRGGGGGEEEVETYRISEGRNWDSVGLLFLREGPCDLRSYIFLCVWIQTQCSDSDLFSCQFRKKSNIVVKQQKTHRDVEVVITNIGTLCGDLCCRTHTFSRRKEEIIFISPQDFFMCENKRTNFFGGIKFWPPQKKNFFFFACFHLWKYKK